MKITVIARYPLKVRSELTPKEKDKLHSQLHLDIKYQRIRNECIKGIEDYYDKRMDALRLQAEYKKHQLDLRLEHFLKVIDLEVLYWSDSLYDIPLVGHNSIDLNTDINNDSDDSTQFEDKWIKWDVSDYKQDNDKYIMSTIDIVNVYVMCHFVFIAGCMLQLYIKQ